MWQGYSLMGNELLNAGYPRTKSMEMKDWNQPQRPKSHRQETPIWLKERVVQVRKDTRKCALKIHWQLEKEGVSIPARTIGVILKREGLHDLRS